MRPPGSAAMMENPQDYANHRAAPRPLFMIALLVLIANSVVTLVAVIREPGLERAWAVVVALALTIGVYFGRRHAQIVQDRLIRAEMRWRLVRVLPPERHAEIERLTLRQLVALRFASDGELPELVAGTLVGRFPTADAIKRAVAHWQADRLRV